MAKDKKKTKSVLRPRNTVTLNLEGTEQEFIQNFTLCQGHYRYWLLCNSVFRVKYGDKLIYTTPAHGTFYYVLTYQGRYVVLVLDVRTGCLVGYFTDNGVFEMQSKDFIGNYMNSSRCTKLQFEGRHSTISPEGTENTRLNLHWLRKCFDKLCSYKASDIKYPVGFRTALGLMVVLLLESKFKSVYRKICRALVNPIESRLGQEFDWVNTLIVNWSSLSQQAMESLDSSTYEPHDCGIRQLQSLDDLLDTSFYLHLDGYFHGIFKHDALPPAPRDLIWSPVDPGGEGDDHIPFPQEAWPLPGRPAQGRSHAVNGSRKMGLSGGQLGGAPAAPECFLEWSLNENADEGCGRLISHLKELGLDIVDARRAVSTKALLEHHLEKPKETAQSSASLAQEAVEPALAHLKGTDAAIPLTLDDELSEASTTFVEEAAELTYRHHRGTDAGAPLTLDDLQCLQSPDVFISDAVITHAMRNLPDVTGSDELLMVPPSVSHLLGNTPDPAVVMAHLENLSFTSRRLVLFPVNNSKNSSVPGDGTHWSILVFYQGSEGGGKLRLIYHDNSADQTNIAAARQLATALHPHLPSDTTCLGAPTPKQGVGSDCALNVIAIVEEICSWWIRHADGRAEGTETLWFESMMRQVTADSVGALRRRLLDQIQEFLKPPAFIIVGAVFSQKGTRALAGGWQGRLE